jgi:gliding motility-associated-like protein
MSRRPTRLFALIFIISSLLGSSVFAVPFRGLNEDNKGNETNKVPRSCTIEEYEECMPMSPAINFTAGSLYVGTGRFSLWFRGALNEPGDFYVAVYATDPGAMTGAQIRTAAITAGSQNSPVNGAVEIAGTTPVGTFSQQQQFDVASVPDFPSFPGTPYAGSRFTAGITPATTYFYRIVARDQAGVNFSVPIAGSVTTVPGTCGATSPGSDQIGSSPNVCGPRNITMNTSYTGIPYGDPYTMRFRYYFSFEVSGITGAFVDVAPQLANPLQLNRALQTWTAGASNIYPDNGTICAYTARGYLFYQDAGLCNAVFQDQTFEVFDDLANTALGQIGISPPLPTGIEVCEGSTATVNFTNTSIINCVAPEETEKKNIQQRWYQYEYGTNFVAGDFMDKVQVVIPVGTPNFPVGANPFFPGGGTITTFASAYRGPIVMLPATVDETTALPPSFNINVLNTNVFGPDNRFRVTLRMWNICNPYDNDITGPEFPATGLSPTTADLINGDADPITTFSDIILVQEPPIPTSVPKNICQGSALPTFEINYVGASTSVRWYDDNAGVIGALISTQGANNRTLSAATAGITPVPASGTPGVYAVWAQYQRPTTGTVQCFSDPVRTTITVKENPLPIPVAFSTSTTQVCQGDVNVLFELPGLSPAQPIGGATQYEWLATDGVDVAVADVTITPQANLRSALVSFPVPGAYTTRIRKVKVRSIYSAGLTCPSNYREISVTVFGPSQVTGISANQTFCEGTPAADIVLSGIRGSVNNWERRVNLAGGFLPYVPFGTATTVLSATSTPLMPVIGGITTIYEFRAVVQNGTCPTATSPVIRVTVNPVPTSATITGNATICQGSSTNLTVTIVGGTSPYLVNYTANGVPQPPRVAYISGTPFPVSPAVTTTYVLTSVTDAAGPPACSAPLFGSAVVTVSNPSSAVIDGDFNICPGSSANFNVVVTGGVGPYTLRYSDGGPPITLPGYVSGTPISTGPLAVSRTYTIVDVRDANNCLSLANSGSAIITVGSVPSAATFTATGFVCQNLPYNLTLTITGGVSPYTITVNNGIGTINNYVSGSPIPVPTAVVGPTTYTATFVRDACMAVLGSAVVGTPTVTVNPLPSAANQTPTTCSDASGGTTATVDLTLLNTAINAGAGVTTTIAWFSNAGLTVPVATPAAAVVTNAVPIFARVTTNATGCISSATVTYTVNPRPPLPVGPVNGIACSVPGTGVPLSVTDPGPGFEIEWSTAGPAFAAFAAAVPASGAESGPNNRTFTPATSATATFFAFTRNTTTGCFSSTGRAVTQTQDLRPTPAVAGPNQPLLCTTSTTLAATPVNNGGNGVWSVVGPVGTIVITTPTSPTSTVTGLPQDVPGGAPILTTLRWTANSALGVCSVSTSDVILTVNPRPVVNNLTPILCEDVFLGASTANVNLATTYNIAVMGGTPANTGVQYYPTAADRTAGTNEILAPITVTNAMVRFTRVRNTVTGCISDGTITFTVRTLPLVTNQSAQVCEDVPPGSNQRTGLNLQTFENSITGGVANRNVEWYTDASLGVGFLIPPGGAVGAEQNYTINADVTLHAKVIDTTPATPQCFRAATLNLDYQARPNNNQISDGIGQVLGASYTVCASNNLVLLQINPGLNPGATYTWTVPPVSYPGEFQLLTGTTGFFIILRFPNAIPDVGTLYPTGVPITVKETLGTALCDGNTINTRIIVQGSPPQPIISGPSSVCSNANSVVFSVTNPVAGTYSWSLPAGATITSLPVTDPVITVQMSTFSGNVNVTHASGIGCTSPAAAPFPVTVINRPTITSVSARTVCSGTDMSVAHTLTSNIVGTTFNWEVINITGSVIGAIFGDLANGVLAINQTLSNSSGVNASVTYRITPVGPGPDNCPGTPQNFTVTVNPQPVIVPGQTKTICSANAVAKEILLSPGNLPAGTLFSWPDPDGAGPATSGVSIPMGVAGTIHINDVLVNLSNSPIVVNYVITPTSGASCVGVAETIAITVNPQPVGANDNTPLVCSGLPAGYDLETNIATLGNNLIAGTTYSWVATANGSVSGESTVPQTGKTITDVLRNFTNSNQVVRYTATPTSGAGCAGVFFLVDITVRPEPVGFDDASPIICSDANVNYDLGVNIANTGAGGNNLTAGTTYSWVAIANPNVTGESTTSQAGSVITDVINNITNSNHVVVYTVTPTSAQGCAGAPFIVLVTVRPEPKGFNDPTPVICSDANVNYNLEANILNTGLGGNGLISGTTYAWTATPNPDVTGETNGVGSTINNVLNNITNANQVVIYTVTATSANGCAGDPFTVSVSVRPEPQGFNDVAVICSDQSVNYSLSANIANTGSGGNNLIAGTTYSWVATPSGSVTGESTTPQAGNTITDALNNITNANQVVVYTVIPTSVNGCAGNPFTVSVTVQPEPVGHNDPTPVVCSDVALAYDLSANIANLGLGGNNLITGTTYSWVAAATATVSGESTVAQAGPVINDVLNNITNSNQTVVYTVTPASANSCVGNPFTITVTVRPEPRGFNDNSPTVCSDAAINYSLPANIANTGAGGNNLAIGTTYSWIAADNLNVTGESTSAQTGNTIIDVVNNITNGNEIVVYTITPTSGDGCIGNPFTVSVTVRPEPKGFNDVATVCSDIALTYNLSVNIANTGAGGNNLTAGTTYSWVAANNVNVGGESVLPQTGATITDILNNVTNANQVVVYTVTPTNGGCIGNTFTVSVTVQPEPRGFNDNTPIVCSNAVVNYNLSNNVANTISGGNNLTAGTIYSWIAANNGNVSGESTVAQAGPIITDLLINSTNGNEVVVYTITPTSANGCIGNPFTVSVNVRPEPRGFNDNTPVVCSDVAMSYDLVSNITNTASGGNNLAVGTTYSWIAADNLNVTGESLVAKAGAVINDVVTNVTNALEVVVYTITPTSVNGCVGAPFLVSVTVRPEPQGFNDPSTIICSDGVVGYALLSNIANTGAGGNNLIAGTTYSWVAAANANVGGESIAPQVGGTITDALNNITNVDQVVVYTVTPTSALGCVGNTFTVSVTVRPEPQGFNDNTPIICSDATVNYALTTNVANTGSGGNNLITGTTYSWIAANNLFVTGESTVAQAGAIITDALNNISSANQVVVYTVTPTSANGCIGNTFTVSVTVRPEPKGFDDPSPLICSDANVNYDLVANISNVGLGGNGLVVGTTYSWIAADNPNVTGESTTAQTGNTINNVLNNVSLNAEQVIYTITPTSANSCVGDPFTVTVTVRPEPRGFNDPSPVVCSDVAINYDLVANIANTGAGGNNLVTGTTYSWIATPNTFVTGEGSGTTSTITDIINNVTTSSHVVVYTVTPTSANGCVGNPFTVSVTVNPEPRGFNDPSPVVCSDAPVNYNLNANIANTGSGGNNLVTGTYSWLAAANGNITGESTVAQTGSTINDVLNNITNVNQIVVYTITPTSGAGCDGNPFIVSITVRPEPRGFDDTKTICSDANVNYDLTANIGNTGSGGNNLLIGTTYSWIAADNASVTGETTILPGTSSTITDVLNNITNVDQIVVYTVTPTSNNGCVGDTFTVSITVRPEPRGFNDASTIICSDGTVGYALLANIADTGAGGNNLIAGTTYTWIAAANASVAGESTTIQAGGIITDMLNNITNVNQVVVYTVVPTSSFGCVGDPFTVSVTVRPEPKGFNDNSPVVCSNANVNYDITTNIANTVSGGNNLVAGTTYSWLAADNPSVTGETLVAANTSIINDILTNVTGSNQVVVYTVTATSADGCIGNPFTISVTVRPEPIGLADTDAVCSDEAIAYNIQTRNINLLGNSVASQFTYTVVSSDPGNVSAAGKNRPVASNAAITDTYTNTTSNDVFITYSITPFSTTGNCQGAPFDVVITIHPEPRGPNTTFQRCSDDPVNFDLQNIINTVGTGNSVVSKFRYVVTSNNALAVPPGPNRNTASTAVIADVYTNITNADVEITYTVTPVSVANDCEGSVFTFKVIVNPEPVGANVVDPVCSTSLNYNIQTQNINTLGNAVPSVFTYTVASSDALNVPPAADRVVATNLPITDAYVNSTGVDVTITYTITPISSANNCPGTPFTYAVTISSKPVGADVTKANVCSDVPFSFNPQSDITNGVIGTFTWTATYQPGLSVGGVAPPATGNGLIAGSLTNKGSTVLNATYVVTPTAGTCVGDPFTITVPIQPEPVVANNLNAIVCSGDIYNTLLNTDGLSIGAANYDVTAVVDAGLTGIPTTGLALAANALVNDAFQNVSAIPLKVTYTITPHGTNACVGDPKLVELTINPEPVVNPALDNTVCSRDISGIILSTNGTSVAANSYRLVGVVVPGTITADLLNAPVGSTGNINLIRNDKFINNTSAAVTVIYEIVGISPALCEGQSEFINLIVNPEPILSPGTANLCSDVPSGIIVGPAVGSATITQFELKNIVKAPALVAGGSNAGLGVYPANLPGGQSNFLSNDTFTNTTNGPLIVTYTVVPIATGCRGQDQTIVFTVNPAPAVDDNLNKTVCSDEVAGIVFATETSPLSTAAASYNIATITVQAGLVRTAGNALVPRNGVAPNDIQADQFRNPTNNPLTVTYGVQAVSGASCLGPIRNIILTVEPEIIAAPVNNAPSICSNSQTDIDLISPTNPTSGVVTFNYTAVSSVGGLISGFVPALNNLPENYKIQDALVNNSDNPATVTYSISAVANGARNGGGCSSLPPAVTRVVTVDPKPKLIATPSIQTVCEGVATSVVLNSNTVPSAGNVRFELLSATASGGVTGMSAVGTLFAPASSLADVLSNPTVTSQTVTYTFQPKVIGGLACAGDNVTVTITVNPLPTIVASAQPDICSGDFVNITLTPDVVNTVATWTVSAPLTITGESNGAGNLIFQTLFNSGNIPETVTYTVTPRVNGCNGTPIIISAVVNPKPKFVGLPPTVTVCHGGTLNVPLTSTVAGTTFDWVVDDPSGLGVPLTGSGNVINQPLTNTTGSQASLTYTITPTGPGACPGDQKFMIVAVAPQISAQFLNTNSSICKGSSEFLIMEVQGQAPFQIVYNDGITDITLNNSGNVKVVQVVPTVTTTYTIKSIKDALNCTFLPVGQTVTVTVGETDANFSIVGPAASCGPYTATFQFNQVAGTEYTWQWFDGSPDDIFLAATTIPNNTISHTFTNPNPNAAITYKVTLRTQLPAPFPGCFKTTTRNVTVFPSIITNAFPDRSDICSGESIQFFNQSFGATTHRWFYRVQGTGTEIDIRTTPSVNYTLTNTSTSNPIIYEVVYQANNGNCPAADVVMPITVYRAISAGFNEGTIPPFIGGNSTVTFTNTSTPVDAAQFRYEWTFGLNSTPATGNGAGPFSVNYSTPGPRDITLKVVNIAAETAFLSCESSFTKTINIPLLPLVAAFTADPVRACFPSDITVLTNTSTGDLMDWRVVDSNGRIAATSNAALPVFRITNPGAYSIFLTTSNSLTGQVANTQQNNFEIFDNPVASFDLRPTTVFVPDTELTTFNFSIGATDYDWDFGDGGKSVDVEPVYIYKVEGAYDVRLIARNDRGQGLVCTDTLIRKVTAKQGGVTKVPNAFTPNPNGPSGGPSGGSGTFNDVFLPIVKGADEFNMQIFDRWGNLIFESNSANVGWDGYNESGKLLPAGVYVYKLTVRLSDGQRSTQIGDVTMIR